MGWEKKQGESEEISSLRAIVLFNMGVRGNRQVISEALKKFNSGYENIDPNLRSVVYKIVLANHDDQSYFDRFLEIYRSTSMSEERVRILDSLGYISNPSLFPLLFDFMQSDDVRPQDRITLLGSISDNPKGRDFAWNYLSEK